MQPKPPPYAWDWLQRSRPVLAEAAQRLTGQPPGNGFVDDLRARFEDDAFTRDVLAGVIADVAFGGRVPDRPPPKASWDRGLRWWAAALAGTTPAAFDRRKPKSPGAGQASLFSDSEGDPGHDRDPERGSASARDSERGSERGSASARDEASARDPASTRDGPVYDERAREQALRRLAARSPERAAIVARLRDLLASSDGDQVPASAVRDLLAELE